MDDYEDKKEDFRQYLLLEKKYSNNTANSYIEDLETFIKYFKNKKSLKKINRNDINDYITFLSNNL